MGAWQHKVSRFIALNQFAQDKFIAAGLPAERIVVKPNFMADPFATDPMPDVARKGALYVGRLSAEKGVGVLVDAWREMDMPLTILGDGPDRAALEARAGPNVHFLGHRDRAFVQEAMRAAAVLVVPSIWFEMFPMTVVEAMACGTPLVVSRIGALAEIVEDGKTGVHFTAGDAADLARTLRSIFAEPAVLARMGQNARRHYEKALSPHAGLAALEGIYREIVRP